MISSLRSVLLAGAVAMTVVACARQSPAPEGGRAAAPARGAAVAPPANSPLGRVRTGMRATEVQEILGKPTNERTHITGKQFVPFYYGPDATRTIWYYRGMGRVVYNGGNVWGAGGGTVREVQYDPAETGAGTSR